MSFHLPKMKTKISRRGNRFAACGAASAGLHFVLHSIGTSSSGKTTAFGAVIPQVRILPSQRLIIPLQGFF